MPLASVYPLVSARALARPFTYEVPDDVGRGAVVDIPFGRSKRRGIVVGFEDAPPGGVVSPVDGVRETVPAALVDLALWIADYYGSTPARAWSWSRPAARRRKEQPPPGERHAFARRGAPGAPLGDPGGRRSRGSRARSTRGGGHFLLYGATGSGKTEVYLRACEAALARGRGAIVLVPEIALDAAGARALPARFGDRVAVLHSGLTDAERRDERQRIARGEAPVVVGARSAIFAPLPRLGLVCVDEEHDPSYKQDRTHATTRARSRRSGRRSRARSRSTGARRRGRRAGSGSSG